MPTWMMRSLAFAALALTLATALAAPGATATCQAPPPAPSPSCQAGDAVGCAGNVANAGADYADAWVHHLTSPCHG